MKKQNNLHKYTAWFGVESGNTFHKFESREVNVNNFIQKLLYYNSSPEIWDKFISLNLEGFTTEQIIEKANTIISPYVFVKVQDNGKTIYIKE